jgi:hypothetical protein
MYNNIKQYAFHQTLHGYSDGHRLIASSVELSKDTQRTMLVLSDMSGPSMVDGFMEYLTGYSLSSDNFFVFSKTWFAPEMRRPGCVWTHSILLSVEQLEIIQDIRALLTLFTKPKPELPTTFYKKPIMFDSLDLANTSVNLSNNRLNCQLLGQVILSLFETRGTCVLPSETSYQYEDEVLSLWSQLWPKGRASLSFSTGSITPRTLNNRPFDIQVSPRKTAKQFLRQNPKMVIVDGDVDAKPMVLPTWIECALSGIISHNNHRVKTALWEYSSLLQSDIYSYRQLIEIYMYEQQICTGITTPTKLISDIFVNYPTPDKGTLLKFALFNPHGYVNKHVSVNYLLHLAEKLFTTDKYGMLSSEYLDLKLWADWLLEDPCDRLLLIFDDLLKGLLNPYGEDLFHVLAESLSVDDALLLSKHNPGILSLLIVLNPGIAADKRIWVGAIDAQKELLEQFVKSKSLDSEIVPRVIIAILDAGCASLILDLYKYFGDICFFTALDWFNTHEPDLPVTDRIHTLLSKAPQKSLFWLSNQDFLHPRIIGSIAGVIDPHAEYAKHYGPDLWLKIISLLQRPNVSDRFELERIKEKVSGFLLPFAFIDNGVGVDQLVAFSFPIVHRLLGNNTLNYEVWRNIEPLLPELNWYRGWDKCERLRLKVLDGFIDNNWNANLFLDCIKDHDIFDEIVKTALSTRKGKKYLQFLTKNIISGNLKATDYQTRWLYRNI